jgi:hypothetical protein
VVFVESREFSQRLQQLAGNAASEILSQIQQDLLANPERGNIVQGLAGIRKARVSNPTRGKGKRGGFRYFFLYLERRHHIHLLFLLDKDEEEDLSVPERKVLRALVEQIKGNEGR